MIAGERGKLRRYMTERMTRPRGKTALLFLVTAALLTAIVLLACGPAADDGEKEGDPAASAVPTATPKGDEPTKQPDPPATAAPTETPKPAEEPTKTPEPTPAEKSTETPKPTRHPDDPPSPTATPVPTYPPQTPGPVIEDPVIRDLPHPDGIQGCRSMNMFVDALSNLDYYTWCRETLESDVQTNCSGQDGTTAQLQCARNRLAETQSPFLKSLLPCTAITYRDARAACITRETNELADKTHQIWQVWPQILNRVDSDAKVKKRKQEIGKCMLARGYDEHNVATVLPWQINEKPDAEKPADRYATTAEERAAMRAKYTDLHECALESGIYDVQEELWFAEVQRLEQQDPSSVEALLDFGLKEALELEGPAPFLTFR